MPRVILDEEAVAQMRAEQAGQTGTFTDVPADAWYAPYVDAAGGGRADERHRQRPVQPGEYPEPGGGRHPYRPGFTRRAAAAPYPPPPTGEAWYQGAYDYCVDNGLFTAEEVAASHTDE